MTRRAQRAEEALLGAMLFRPEALPGMRWLPPGAFCRPDHGALWRVLHGIDWSAVTPADVPAAVTRAVEGIEDRGIRLLLTPARLTELAGACPEPRNAALYGGMTLEAAIHRTVEQTGTQLRQTAQAAEVDQAAQVLDRAQDVSTRLDALSTAWRRAPETVRTLLDTPTEGPVTLAERGGRVRADPAAEAETVASLLWDPGQMHQVHWLQPDDISDPQLAVVYQAMTTLHQRHAPIDPVTLAWEAARQPGVQPSDRLLDELEHGRMGGIAARAGGQVLGTAALDRLDAAGHRIRNLGRHPGLAPSALIDHATADAAQAAADRERVQQAERDPERRQLDLAAREREDNERRERDDRYRADQQHQQEFTRGQEMTL